MVSMAAKRRSLRITDDTWKALEAIAQELNEGRDPESDPLRAEATTSMVINMAIREFLQQRTIKQSTAAA